MTDLEVGRYALRSFKFARVLPPVGGSGAMSSDLAMSMSYGEWRRANVDRLPIKWMWQAPTFANADDWLDGTCAAVCRKWAVGVSAVRHDAPDESCSCGIYGSLSYADLLSSFMNEARSMVAVFAAEGTTIIGTRGLRTQFARVVGYWVDCARPDAARAADGQFVDASAFGDPLALVEAFGLSLLPPSEVPGDKRIVGKYWTGKPDD